MKQDYTFKVKSLYEKEKTQKPKAWDVVSDLQRTSLYPFGNPVKASKLIPGSMEFPLQINHL